jgi:HD-GYP domain-containing protein (c-di-GMP phosphodiesterase class II)
MNAANQVQAVKKEPLLEISLSDLKEGMKFSAPVLFEGENLLVEAGIPIRARDLEKLVRLGIKTVATEGWLLPPERESARNHTTLHLFYIKDEEARCLKLYTDLLNQARILFSLLKKKEPIDKKNLDDTISDIYRAAKEHPKEMIQIVHGVDNSTSDPATSALHCAIVAVVMACQRKSLSHETLALTASAFLRDIGMLFIPRDIREKKGGLEPRELAVIRTHSALSYTMLRELGYPIDIANAVLDHHERWDGKGYPRKVPGARIHEQALVVAVADAYTALINRKPYREHFLGYDAVKKILHGVGQQYSAETVKLLLQGIGIYPLGTVVLLSNYSVARVIETGEDSALRPKVEIIRDKYGEKITPPNDIDLAVRKDLYIVKAIDPVTLTASEQKES